MAGKRLPRRDCHKCEGNGFLMGTKNGHRVVTGKCDCWRYVDFDKKKSAVSDGKVRSVGSE